MKKLIGILMAGLLTLSMVSSAYAVGENVDEETSCSAVNQQTHKGESSEGAGSSEEISSGSSVKTL